MKEILEYLQSYQGRPLKLMEVCGTHTAEINKNGIPGLLPPSIQLVSGPGCPVCVTVTEYIDRLIDLGKESQNIIVTFGDMLRVPGSRCSLSEQWALKQQPLFMPCCLKRHWKKESKISAFSPR